MPDSLEFLQKCFRRWRAFFRCIQFASVCVRSVSAHGRSTAVAQEQTLTKATGQYMKKHLGWITAGLIAAAPFATRASDHAEAPLVESDQAADIADIYAFLDPNNNSNVVLALDVHGFIVPGENGNLSGFDPDVLFRFNIENTGDAAPDKSILITFDPQTSRSQPQTAHVSIVGAKKAGAVNLAAPTTVGSNTASNAPVPTETTDAASGLSYFAVLTV